VVRREHHEHGVGVVGRDARRGERDRGRGVAAHRLDEHAIGRQARLAAHGARVIRAADQPHVARLREAARTRHGLGEQAGGAARAEQRLRPRLAGERPEARPGPPGQDHRHETRRLHRPTLWYSKPAFVMGPGS
jgi:hypothetical protein